MKVLAALCVVITAALVATAAEAGAQAQAQERSKAALEPFGSCTQLVRYARGTVLRTVRRRDIPPWTGGGQDDSDEALSGGGGRGGGLDEGFSTTNVQEPGVDEPDLVKTDGSRLFTVSGSRVEAIDVRGTQPIALGDLRLGEAYGHELLLLGDRLLVLSHLTSEQTLAREVDVSDPAAMRVVSSITMDGSYVSARMAGGSVRLVTSAWPRALRSLRGVRRGVRSAAWLPRATVRRAPGARPQRRKLVDCRSVHRTASVTGLEVVTVVTLGFENGLQQLDADALMTGSETVYASPRSLYVGAHDFTSGRTGLHRFDTSEPASTAYTASGSVPGHLLDQWALSEHDGHLRAASTTGAGDESESRVTVLREAQGRLDPVGLLTGLGRTEAIEGVRFEGDVGYVVTFRQIDPLYTVDLAEPAHPRVLGELKIPGYSDYLHPVGPGLLLGVGQDATFSGEAKGTQVSLFDVSDLRAPRRLSNLVLGSRYRSPVEEEHRAFLFWPPTSLAVLPIDRWREATTRLWAGAAVFRVSATGLTEVTRVAHPGTEMIERSLVAGGRLLTVSSRGVMSHAVTDAGDGRWLAFR